MTDEERPAGRELDALVAEHVMALGEIKMLWVTLDYESQTWNRTHVDAKEITDYPMGDDQQLAPCYCTGEHLWKDTLAWERVAEYSTDIAAAWQVVEKMREKHCIDFSLSEGFNATFLAAEWITDCAETMPLAICRAALKVVAIP